MQGNDFIYVLVAFVVELGLYLLLNVLLGVGKLPALIVALPFLFGPLAWVLCLRHNKPDGYAEDWFDQKFNGEGWAFMVRAQPPSPIAMKSAPNGHFAEGLILFGSLEKGGTAAKGYVLQPPDLRGGSVAHLNSY